MYICNNLHQFSIKKWCNIPSIYNRFKTSINSSHISHPLNLHPLIKGVKYIKKTDANSSFYTSGGKNRRNMVVISCIIPNDD